VDQIDTHHHTRDAVDLRMTPGNARCQFNKDYPCQELQNLHVPPQQESQGKRADDNTA
jgi:hypothetical protein